MGGFDSYSLRERKKSARFPRLLGQMRRDFNQAVEAFVSGHRIPVVAFKRGERKDDVAQRMRWKIRAAEW